MKFLKINYIMEELSIEEKAKRYDEVIERAKHYQKVNGSAVIPAIFPELKESEDEKIKAIKSFNGIRKGSLGGWIESEDNLSQEGDCWILHEAKVFRKAKVSENAKVKDNACIYGNACVRGNAKISGNAEVYGNVCIYDYVSISGYAKVFGSISICGYAGIRGDAIIKLASDYAVFENIYSTSNYFTWTRSNNMWAVGCFYGTGKELIKRGYKNSKLTGKCYEEIVKAQEEVLKITNN